SASGGLGGSGRTRAARGFPSTSSFTSAASSTTHFCYTSLGSACATPDTGTTLCSGNPGAVCRRTDARSITTTYAYDALNRLTSKTYNDAPHTPTANFYYDETSVLAKGQTLTLTNTLGRLSHTSAASGAALTVHSYDAMGRIKD